MSDIDLLEDFFERSKDFIKNKQYSALVSETEKIFNNEESFFKKDSRKIRPYLFREFLSIIEPISKYLSDDEQERIISAIKANILYSLHEVLDVFKNNEKIFNKLFLRFFDQTLENVDILCFLIANPNLFEIFKNFVRDKSKDENTFDKLTSFAIRYYSPNLLIFLKEINNELFKQSLMKLNQAEQDTAKQLLSIMSCDYTSKLMPKIIKGFGALDYECGLLACASVEEKAIRGNKEYQFDPVVLKSEEMEDFFRFILEHPDEIGTKNIKFIITGSHWLSGQLQYNENSELNILIMDSLGNIKDEVPYDVQKFSDKLGSIGLKSNVFYASEDRQHSLKGCSVFALDDCRHLFTCEKYLPSQYFGLFDFLQKNIFPRDLNSSETKLVTLKRSKLPIYLLKTWQSKALKSELEQRIDEAKLPFNKKEPLKLPSELIASYFKLNPETSKEINIRLSEKLAKISENCRAFLVSHTDEEVARSMDRFSLEGFKTKTQALVTHNTRKL